MNRFLPSLLTIFLGLGLGFLLSTLFRRYAKNQDTLPSLRIQLQKLCLLVLNPIAFIGAVWILPIERGPLILLPLVCIFGQASGFFIGYLSMRIKPLPPAQAIGFRTSCSFTNTGNMGGLIVYLLLGEVAFALVPLYKLFEEFWCYGVLFPYARQQAIKAGLIQERGKQRHPLLRIASDPFFLIVVCSIMLGLTFNLLDFERPEVYAEINSWLIPTSSFLLLAAIGTQIRIGRIPLYWKPALAISLLRMCLIPFCVLGFALLLGFGSGDVLTLKTIAIMGIIPMAFISLVPASLYNLDSDLISTAWLFTTGSLIVSVPLLSFLLA